RARAPFSGRRLRPADRLPPDDRHVALVGSAPGRRGTARGGGARAGAGRVTSYRQVSFFPRFTHSLPPNAYRPHAPISPSLSSPRSTVTVGGASFGSATAPPRLAILRSTVLIPWPRARPPARRTPDGAPPASP